MKKNRLIFIDRIYKELEIVLKPSICLCLSVNPVSKDGFFLGYTVGARITSNGGLV